MRSPIADDELEPCEEFPVHSGRNCRNAVWGSPDDHPWCKPCRIRERIEQAEMVATVISLEAEEDAVCPHGEQAATCEECWADNDARAEVVLMTEQIHHIRRMLSYRCVMNCDLTKDAPTILAFIEELAVLADRALPR
jgi:hypothetical protein